MEKDILYAGFNDMFEIVHKKEKGGFKMPPHMHNAIEIYFNMTDVPNVLLGTNLLPFSKDTLLIIPSYCVHKVMSAEELRYERYILTINTGWLESVLGETINNKYSYFKDSQNPLLIKLEDKEKKQLVEKFDRLIRCKEEKMFTKLNIFFEIMDWVHRITRMTSKTIAEYVGEYPSGTAKTVSEMMNYINDHLCENITVEDIADSLFINHDYASRIFKKYVNTTVKQFITLQRITRAKQLLLEGNTVTQTQNLTGYNSYEHFFRTFKKITGMTPKEYKMLYLKNDECPN